MSIADAMDALRSDVPGCSMVVYADLSSRLVLGTSTTGTAGQEELDALAKAAQLALNGAVAESASAVWEERNPGAAAETAMLLTGAEARVFLRSPGESPETLICVCAPDTDLNLVVDCGRDALDRILGEGK